MEPAARRPQHREPEQDGQSATTVPDFLRRGRIQPGVEPQPVRWRWLPLSPPEPERVHHGDGGEGVEAHREGHGQTRNAGTEALGIVLVSYIVAL